ncbi:AFG1-like ATPase-domain-containing protein [Rhodofomes roseus]|uniref:AFG1-like ATPase-domain-containing protein n=1 Tax=Rhodofomes roseus TaxID=34475 RepID=A0ABQ8KA58_9APHY|nr:AFG1-like ATPase-domain-containing protein [Rhodofomes roseus]KAH9833706.1 AFG1-like ATPase-domain-containing protein [Rhodofomes roseus]
MRPILSLRPYIASTRHRLTALPHRRLAVRSIVNRSIAHRRRLNSSLAADRTTERQGLSDREAAILHAKYAPQSQSEQATSSPLARYHKLVDSGVLRYDEHQERIIGKLQKLHDEVANYHPPPVPHEPPRPSLFSRFLGRSAQVEHGSATTENKPKGLYLYGDVGTGKTMLMDLFYETIPPHIKRKRRVHFHAFMIDVHKRVHATKAKLGYQGGDVIGPVARELANEAYILCFDEFQVTDIADAMILRQLFERLLSYGVICVITSNRHPDELYKNGIQRSSFVPCIELLNTQFDVTDLDSGTDYRRIPRTLSHVYYDPLTPENTAEVEKIFKAITSDPSDPVQHHRKLTTWGRTITVPESSSTVAKFQFDELCGMPLSAADYLEIVKHFKTIFIFDVPKMGMNQKDKARRFITFIDACYESKAKLFITSEAPIAQIFSEDGDNASDAVSDQMRQMMDDLGLPSDMVISSSVFSGDEELFAFARCCSRLVQMGSKEWAETAGAS